MIIGRYRPVQTVLKSKDRRCIGMFVVSEDCFACDNMEMNTLD